MEPIFLESKIVKETLIGRLEREISKGGLPALYIVGYKTAVYDVIWDLFNEVPKTSFDKMFEERLKKVKE
jgi:hypothetical protein